MNKRTIFTAIILIILVYPATYGQRLLAETSFDLENVSIIKIQGRFCNVNIQKGNTNRIEAKITGSGDADDYQFESDLNGDRLYFEVISPNNSWNSIREAYITVTVNSISELEVSNSSGNVTMKGIDGTTFDIQSTSGNVEIENLTADRLYAKSTSGNVYIKEVNSSLRAGSTSGNLDISEIKGDVSAKSTSGNIKIRYFEGPTEAESTSGNIMIANGKGVEYLKTTSGDIDGYDLMLDREVTLRSTSGDITLSVMNDFEELSFDLNSNSGDLRAGRYDSEDDLYIKNGNIWIKGTTTSGDLEIR